MKYAYLVSSLPRISLTQPPPLSLDDFREACTQALSPGDLRELELVLEDRGEEARSSFAREWARADRQFRNAVVALRASFWGLDAAAFTRPETQVRVWLEEAVTEAFAQANPLEREKALDQCRWEILEELALEDPFGLHGVLAYALRLRMATRWSRMEKAPGQKSFRDFVNRALEAGGYVTAFEHVTP